MSKNDWTNKLRDQLADHQEPVSHDLWAGIESSLAHQDDIVSDIKRHSEKQDAERQEAPIGRMARIVAIKRWTASAAAIALLGIGGGYVYLHHESVDVDDAKGQVASGSSSTSLSSASSLPSRLSPGLSAKQLAADCKSAERLARQAEASKLASSSSSSSAVSSNLLAADYKSAERLAGDVASSNDADLASAPSNEAALMASVPPADRTEKGYPVESEKGRSYESALSSNSNKLESLAQNQEVLAQNQEVLSQNQTALSRNQTVFAPKQVSSADMASSAPYDFSSSKSHDHDLAWSVNLYAENFISNSQAAGANGVSVASDPMSGGVFNDGGTMVDPGAFSEKATFLAAATPWLRASRYQKAKHHAPLAVGMQVGIEVAPRLALSTGVVYTRTSSDFQPNGVNDFTVHQVLHYVGVPLGVNYRVWRKSGFSAYVMAGGEADFNVKNDTEDSGFKEDAKRDRPQFSAKTSLGLQYDITPQVGLYMEPGAKYYFGNGSGIENTFKDKKLNFNFQFGLRWNVGK